MYIFNQEKNHITHNSNNYDRSLSIILEKSRHYLCMYICLFILKIEAADVQFIDAKKKSSFFDYEHMPLMNTFFHRYVCVWRSSD